MKAVGVIVEYNPFHNGHKYHYEIAKKYGDIVIAVMSGDYLQRGEPALIDRWKRTEIALKNGIDIVIELPIFYSTQSAEIFARGGVGILDHLGVKTLVFGSETADIESIKKRANLVETSKFKENLKELLKSGVSYPTAYSTLLDNYNIKNVASNDILAIEYIKAINFWKSEIKPIAIKRESSTYYSKNEKNGIMSATGIRNKIFIAEEIKNVVPTVTYDILKNSIEKKMICRLEDFYPLIRYKILTEKENMEDIQDIEIGYSKRIYEAALKECEFSQFFELIKSKRYTIGRVQRILIHILLGITKKITNDSKNNIPYIRVLGFNKRGQKYLKTLKDKEITIFSNLKNIKKNLTLEQLSLLEKNENASKIYSIINSYEDRKIPIIFDEDD